MLIISSLQMRFYHYRFIITGTYEILDPYY